MGDTAVVEPVTVVHAPQNRALYEDQPLLAEFKGFDWSKGTKDDAIRFARVRDFNETGMSVNEVGLLYECLEQMGRGYIVELGRNYGTSTRLFMQHVIRHGGTLDSWDLKVWPGMIEKIEAAGYIWSGECSNLIQKKQEDTWGPYDVRLRIAHSIKTPVERDDRFVDFLLIDTEHGLEDALGEYMRWRQYLKSGGFVAFHDSTLPGPTRAIQIVREVEAAFDGRMAEHHVNDQVDGYGIEVFRWKQ